MCECMYSYILQCVRFAAIRRNNRCMYVCHRTYYRRRITIAAVTVTATKETCILTLFPTFREYAKIVYLWWISRQLWLCRAREKTSRVSKCAVAFNDTINKRTQSVILHCCPAVCQYACRPIPPVLRGFNVGLLRTLIVPPLTPVRCGWSLRQFVTTTTPRPETVSNRYLLCGRRSSFPAQHQV